MKGRLFLELLPHDDGKGYLAVQVPLDRGGSINKKLHHLIWELHNGMEVPDGMVVRHLNDIQTDNRPENLAVGTQKQNMEDRTRNGNDPCGERNGHAKLKKEEVLDIRARAARGEPLAQIAREYKLYRSSVQRIVNRETWKHV